MTLRPCCSPARIASAPAASQDVERAESIKGVATMTTRRHWFSYGTDPLPTGPEALDEPFSAFPSWFLCIECDHCGKVQMVSEAHMKRALRRSATSSPGYLTTAAADDRDASSCSLASRAPAAARCARSCCARDAAPQAHLWRRPAHTAHRSPQRLCPLAGVLQLVPPPGRRRSLCARGVLGAAMSR